MTMIHIPQLIEHKRDGGELSAEEIRHVIRGFTNGTIPDYQMSALSMAIFYSGMSEAETSVLTAAMRDSGSVFVWPSGTPPKVDKHSTGGVGDKISLVLAPLLACGDVWVPMVSGRGLGITGGTLDKLESIPGFNVHLRFQQGLKQLEKHHAFLAGQTDDFCPADKKLYALRDVTGTVPSMHLIIASIMSKKLAESLDRLVLDVKFGAGAFMKSRESAEQLAKGLQAAGNGNGIATSYVLSPMDEPIGRAVGNWLEVREAVDVLRGEGPRDVRELVLDLAEYVDDCPRKELVRRLDSGRAYEKFLDIVGAQSGEVSALEKPHGPHSASVKLPLPAPQSGELLRFDAGIVGAVVVRLGGGRQASSDEIDFSVGLDRIVKVGEKVAKGDPLCIVHAPDDSAADGALRELSKAIQIG